VNFRCDVRLRLSRHGWPEHDFPDTTESTFYR
jgi:hypothetical protein